MKFTALAIASLFAVPAAAQLYNPPLAVGAIDQTARDTAAQAKASADASVKSIAGTPPDASGNAALPTSFSGTNCTGCSMSDVRLSGSPTLNGSALAVAPDVASEAAARNAAIASAIAAYVPPVLSVNGSTGAVSVPIYTDAKAVAANAAAVAAVAASAADDVIQTATPSTGGTVSAANSTTVLFINNPALLVSLTVALPSAPADGQRLTVCANAGVTTMSFTGGTVRGALSTFGASGYARFIYSASLASWFRAG